jgi:hypothetical protein
LTLLSALFTNLVVLPAMLLSFQKTVTTDEFQTPEPGDLDEIEEVKIENQ